MITAEQYAAASATISAENQGLALLYIRQCNEYKTQPHRYQDVEGKLAAAATVEIQARQINAILGILNELEKAPQKTVMVAGGTRAVDYNRERDRQRLQSYILSVLFDQPKALPGNFVGELGCDGSNVPNDPLVL